MNYSHFASLMFTPVVRDDRKLIANSILTGRKHELPTTFYPVMAMGNMQSQHVEFYPNSNSDRSGLGNVGIHGRYNLQLPSAPSLPILKGNFLGPVTSSLGSSINVNNYVPSYVNARPTVVPSSTVAQPLRPAQRAKSSTEEEPDEYVRNKRHYALSALDKQRRKRTKREGTGLNGDKRLSINFENYGKLTEHPQKNGNKEGYIPDELSGSFPMYGETWKFEVSHKQKVMTPDGKVVICIEWSIINSDGVAHRVLETLEEARKRDSRGISICNRVFKEALEIRARDYERMIEVEQLNKNDPTSSLRLANLQARVRAMRPKGFSEGPLLFGLRHKIVQTKIISAENNYNRT